MIPFGMEHLSIIIINFRSLIVIYLIEFLETIGKRVRRFEMSGLANANFTIVVGFII